MSPRRALVKNAADEQQVRKGKETEKHRQEREVRDLRAVLSTTEGRRETWLALSRCGIWRLSMSSDTHTTAFNEGRRDHGLWLLARIMESAADLYELMAREARQADDLLPDSPLPEVEVT